MSTGARSTDPALVEKIQGMVPTGARGKLNMWPLPGQRSPFGARPTEKNGGKNVFFPNLNTKNSVKKYFPDSSRPVPLEAAVAADFRGVWGAEPPT